MYRSPAHHESHAPPQNRTVTSDPVLCHLLLHSAITTMATRTHPNPRTTPTPSVHPTPSPDCVHRHGRTKNRIKTTTNTTTAHTPRLAPLRSNDHHRGQSYPPPPQFYPSEILAPRPGQTYVAVNLNGTPPYPPHLLPALHPGPSSPTTLTRPYEIVGMPNVGSRPNLEGVRTRFPFDLHTYISLYHSPNNPDQCRLLYPAILPYHYHHHSPFFSLLFPVSLCEDTHRNAHSTFLIF